MSKIIALNEFKAKQKPKKAKVEEEYNQELQETLVESEYKRALRFKFDGDFEAAFSLLSELLLTKVLNEIPDEEKSRKLWIIRFNCLKNLALIFEENMDEQYKALEHYVGALLIDASDVYLSQRCAQLALKMEQYELAEYWFRNCLNYNPKDLIAADGLLTTLCQRNNIHGAYTMAAMFYNENPNHKLALEVLQDLKHRFPSMFKIFNEYLNPLGEIVLPPYESDMTSKSLINEQQKPMAPQEEPKPDLLRFQIKTFNWQTVGKYIVDLFNYLKQNKFSILFGIDFEVFCMEPPAVEEEKVEEPDSSCDEKPKKRKLESEGEAFQQWHWSPPTKSRRKVRLDPPADGGLFLKYYLQDECKSCKNGIIQTNYFDFDTKETLKQYKHSLKTEVFDLIRIMEYWLEHISSFWSLPMPSELTSLYLQIFRIYQPQLNIPSFNPYINGKELRITLDMYMFFLELDMEKVTGNKTPSEEWQEMFGIARTLISLVGFQYGGELFNYRVRLLNMEYLYGIHNNLYTNCSATIMAFEDVLSNKSKDYILHLPNGHCVDREKLVGVRQEIEEFLKKQKTNLKRLRLEEQEQEQEEQEEEEEEEEEEETK